MRFGATSGLGRRAIRIAAATLAPSATLLAIGATAATLAPAPNRPPLQTTSHAVSALTANQRVVATGTRATPDRIDVSGSGLIFATAGTKGSEAVGGRPPRISLDQLVNNQQVEVADSISKVGDTLVFTGSNTSAADAADAMPMAWTDMLDGLLATPVPVSESSANAELVVASNSLAGDRSWPDDSGADRRMPYRAAAILNRDFSGALTENWQPFGAGVRSVVTRTFVEGLPFVSPAKRQGTFLRARPAAPDTTVGVEQTITVAAGERITFAVLFSSPGHAFGDEVAVDLVSGDLSIPLFMQSGVRAGDPAWQTVDHMIPPGGGGTYKLRFTLVAGRSAAALPSAGFVVLNQPPSLQADRSTPPAFERASWAG